MLRLFPNPTLQELMTITSTYELIRYLHGINAELRNRTRNTLPEGTARKVVDMAASILARIVAEEKTRGHADAVFCESLIPLLAQTEKANLPADMQNDLRQLVTAAHTRQWQAIEPVLTTMLPKLVVRDEPAAAKVVEEIMALEFARRDEVETAYLRETSILSSGGGEHERIVPEELAFLTDFLRKTFPEEKSIEVESAIVLAGGFSKQTSFLNLKGNGKLPATVVMRKDRIRSPLATTVVAEFDLLKILYSNCVAVVEPLALCQQGAITGKPFMITARAAGTNIGDYWDAFDRTRTFGLDLGRQLARLHKLSPDLFGTEIDGATVSTAEHVSREIDSSYKDWVELKEISPVTETAYAWLRRHIKYADGRRSLVHRDVGCHNMLVKDGLITAFVDWEIAWIGNPARDVAYVKDMVTQCVSWEEFLDSYRAEGGIVPSAQELAFYSVWGEVRNIVWTKMAGSIFQTGASDDLGQAYSGSYNMARLYHRLSRRLRDAYRI